jgi:hypothetical protein
VLDTGPDHGAPETSAATAIRQALAVAETPVADLEPEEAERRALAAVRTVWAAGQATTRPPGLPEALWQRCKMVGGVPEDRLEAVVGRAITYARYWKWSCLFAWSTIRRSRAGRRDAWMLDWEAAQKAKSAETAARA